MKKEKSNSFVKLITSAFFAVFFFEFLISVFFLMGLWNKSILEKQIIENNFVQISVNQFSESFQKRLKENGMLNTFAWELVDSRTLYTTFQNKRDEDVETFQKELEQAWDEYLQQEGIESTGNLQLLKSEFVNEVMSDYKKYIRPVFLSKYEEICQKEMKNFQILLIVGGLCSVVSVICAFLWENYTHRSMRSIAMAITVAGVCFDGVVIYFQMRMANFISVLEPEFYKNMLDACREQYQTVALFINVILAVAVVFLLLMVKKFKEQGK